MAPAAHPDPGTAPTPYTVLSPRLMLSALALTLAMPAYTAQAGPRANAAQAPQAKRSFAATSLERSTVSFRLEGLGDRAVTNARITRRARPGLGSTPRSARVSVRSVRGALAGSGRLRLAVPRAWRGRVRRADVRLVLATRPTPTGPTGGACAIDLARLGTARPPGCWRPYGAASPFNRPVPRNPRLVPGSQQMVGRLLSFGPLQHLTAGDAGSELDSGRPLYFSSAADPVYTIRCEEDWGSCSIEGAQVRIPARARVPQASDGHLTVIDPQTGIEWDFWRVGRRDPNGGVLRIGWGGRTRIDGSGLGSDAVAAKTATGAGTLRAEELLSGRIHHALALSVLCDSGDFVFPAAKVSTPCRALGLAPGRDLPLGSRIWLDMSPGQIDALGLNPIRTTLMKALAEYGAYIVDTGGTWGFVTESGLASTSFGAPDPWLEVSRLGGGRYWAPDRRYAVDIRSGIDWARHLRVLDPCAAKGTC